MRHQHDDTALFAQNTKQSTNSDLKEDSEVAKVLYEELKK